MKNSDRDREVTGGDALKSPRPFFCQKTLKTIIFGCVRPKDIFLEI